MDFTHTALELRTDHLTDDFGRAYTYWNNLRARRCCPSWREVDMMALPLRLLPWCSVVDVVDGGADFVFRFFGTARARLQGRDYTGRSIKSYECQRLAKKVITELEEVIRQREPMLYRTTVTKQDPDGIQQASYDVLRLPFSAKEDVDVILNVVNYASMARLIYEWLGVEPPIEIMRNGQP